MSKMQQKRYEDKGKNWVQFPEQCKSCGLCIEICPVKCLNWDDAVLGHFGRPTVKCEIKDCIQCKKCEQICPDMAIRVKD